MNYYEELGLSSGASTEEIRRAYRQLARMLHPDLSDDESSRPAAEAQMKRLNEIVAVLTDRKSRQRYDRGLEPFPTLPAWPLEVPRPGRGAWIWLSACALCGAALVWFFVANQPPLERPPSPIPQARVEELPPAPQSDIRRTERRRRPDPARVAPVPEPVSPEKPEAGPEEKIAGSLEAASVMEAAPVSVPIAPPEVVPPLNREAVKGPEDRGPKPIAPRFAGTWLYAPEPTEAPGLYPPEYIELTITEDGPTMRGRYKGRYRVKDRTISPSVNFEFEGPAQPGEMVWHGPGGARGRMKLKLRDAQSIEMDWWATRLGSEMGLAAGKAVLVRLRER